MYSCWSCRGSAEPLNTWVGVGAICINWYVDMFCSCVHAFTICATSCLVTGLHINIQGGRGLWQPAVNGAVASILSFFALWEKYVYLLSESVLPLMYVGGGGHQDVLGQLRLCPASADHISSIHPCHVPDVACMFASLPFLCNENSICGTSDMVDVSCLHYLRLILV